MTRTKSVAVLLSVVLAVGAGALVYWQTRERLAFKPEVGDDYAFNLTYQLDLTPDKRGTRLPMREMHMDALSRSTVTGRSGGGFEVETGVDFLAFDSDGREVVNTRKLDHGSDRKRAMARLLRGGIRQTVDPQGVAHGAEFVDAETLASLEEDLPDGALAQLSQSMVQMNLFNGGLPTAPLRTGLTWQSPAVTGSNHSAALPAMTYTVSAVDADTVSVDVTQPSEDGTPDKVGYILFERGTGWPLQATLDYTVHTNMMDHALVARARINLRRADQPSPVPDLRYEHMVRMALEGFPVDLSNPDTRRYFLPPFGIKPADEVLDAFNSELMWMPPNDAGKEEGLDIPIRWLTENFIDPLKVTSVTLRDASGATLSGPSAPNPRFDLQARISADWPPSRRATAPLLNEPLNDGQLKALDTLEMTVETSVPDTVYEGTLKKGAASVKLGDAITVSVDSWSPDRIVLRVSRPGGFRVKDWTFLGVIPRDAEGNELPSYHYTASNTALERLMATPALADREVDNELLRDAVDALRLQSPAQRRGDKRITIEPDAPVDSLQLKVMPVKTVSQTWVAHNAGFTLSGGPVVGERTVSEGLIRSWDFQTMNMDDAAIEGVGHHQLRLRMPGSTSRCEAGVADAQAYKGYSLKLYPARYGSGLQLQTTNGLQFFYDLSLGITLQCVTEIEMTTVDVDHSDLVKRIDANTVELSDNARQQLDRVADMAMVSSMDPVGRRADGAALKQLEASGTNQYRFWGEVQTLTLPRISKRESRTFNVTFEPLP